MLVLVTTVAAGSVTVMAYSVVVPGSNVVDVKIVWVERIVVEVAVLTVVVGEVTVGEYVVLVTVVPVATVIVVVLVTTSAGPWAGTTTVRRAARVTRTKHAAMTVPTVAVFLKTNPAKD